MRTYCVADWMSTPPIMVAPTLSLSAAQRLMEQRAVRRLPVVEEGRLVGVIAQADLAREGDDRRVGEAVEQISR